MRMYDHLSQSLVIFAIFLYLIFPIILSNAIFFNIIAFALLGFIMGVIYPDTDCTESIIFRIKQDYQKIAYQESYKKFLLLKRIQKVKNFIFLIISIILIPLSIALRYILYLPKYFILSLIFNGKDFSKNWFKIIDQHRHLAHSVFGIITATALLFIYLTIISQRIPISIYLILSTTSLFSLGAIFHLIQDAATESGVRYFYPFNDHKFFGGLTFDFQDKRTSILFFVLIGAFIITYFIFNNIHHLIDTITTLPSLRIVFLALYVLLITSIIYIVFLKKVCSVKHQKQNEKINILPIIITAITIFFYLLISWYLILFHSGIF